jgi:hypothetical protein
MNNNIERQFEFSNYIFNHCKYLLSYDNKKIIFDLQRIGNINTILKNLENINKKIFKKLEYKLYRNKMLAILDKFISLMMDKGFYCDFLNYNYILYDLKDNAISKDSKNDREEIYFIKMKKINVNENDKQNDKQNDNKNESNTIFEGKTHILFLLHNNNLIYNLV